MKTAAASSRILRGPNSTLRNTTKTPLNMVAMLSTVGIQEASSKPKPNAPRRSGKPTLIRREFKVAIPAPRKTPTIPKYGLVVSARLDGGGGAPLVRTVALTESPGRSRSAAWPESRTIFTGTRCTIFVKLPVALSGGSKANCEPLAGDT